MSSKSYTSDGDIVIGASAQNPIQIGFNYSILYVFFSQGCNSSIDSIASLYHNHDFPLIRAEELAQVGDTLAFLKFLALLSLGAELLLLLMFFCFFFFGHCKPNLKARFGHERVCCRMRVVDFCCEN